MGRLLPVSFMQTHTILKDKMNKELLAFFKT